MGYNSMNPFRYGTVVTDPYFVNREKEIKEIRADLIAGHHLIIYAPRRFGKTSLIKKVLKSLDTQNKAYIDFFQVTSQQRFMDIYTNSLLKTKKYSARTISDIIKKFIKGVTPTVSFDSNGTATWKLNIAPAAGRYESLLDVLDLPQKLAEKYGHYYVVFDEFQEIEKLNGSNFEKQLRSIIQNHRNVSYVFMGSKTHLLLNMFNDADRAFYNIGKLYPVRKIEHDVMMRYLSLAFDNTGFRINTENLIKIIEEAHNIPHYVQYLASIVWQIGLEQDKIIDEQTLDKAINKILDNQNDYYLMLYDNLTVPQRNLLMALIQENTNVFSRDYSQKYNLSSGSSTQRALSALIDAYIIEKSGNEYRFSDPFFPKYLRLRNSA